MLGRFPTYCHEFHTNEYSLYTHLFWEIHKLQLRYTLFSVASFFQIYKQATDCIIVGIRACVQAILNSNSPGSLFMLTPWAERPIPMYLKTNKMLLVMHKMIQVPEFPSSCHPQKQRVTSNHLKYTYSVLQEAEWGRGTLMHIMLESARAR